MKRRATAHTSTSSDMLVDGMMDKRAELMLKMEFNYLTSGNSCGVLTDSQLKEWLEGAYITRHPDDFEAFEILFGHDQDGQDFVVAKNTSPNGLHFAIIAKQGAKE